MTVGHAVIGPGGHGVVEAALATAREPVARAATAGELPMARLAGADVVHVHYTDQLFGRTAAEAARSFVALVARLDRPVTVTLHDLPMLRDPADEQDVARWRRRAAAYADVVCAATGVVTSSRHEADLLVATGAPVRPSTVIPLPVDRLSDPAVRPSPTPEVAVLGWIYPGKGHAAVAAALPDGIGLAALGGVSPGHDDLLVELRRTTKNRLRVTGFLPDASLTKELRTVAVPVAAHEAVSASASVGSWLAVGRRPLVADGAWARELAARCPGSITLVPSGGLAAAIHRALADPDSTWLGDTPVGPSGAEATTALETFCADVATAAMAAGPA